LNRLETVNELLLWSLLYTLILYTEFIPEAYERYQLGWILVVLLILIIAVNGIYVGNKVRELLKKRCAGKCKNKCLGPVKKHPMAQKEKDKIYATALSRVMERQKLRDNSQVENEVPDQI